MNDIKKLIGKRIRDLRQYSGLSQERLSEIADIDYRSLSHIECGDTFPSKALLNIARALNVNVAELFDFEHLELNRQNMCAYVISNIEHLNDSDVKTLYRLVKAMR